MIHGLGLKDQNNSSIQLLRIPHKSISHLEPYDRFTNYSFISTKMSPISWHKLTPPEDIRCGNFYASKFHSLFNKSIRKTDKNFKTCHRIDTQNENPIKKPPNRHIPN